MKVSSAAKKKINMLTSHPQSTTFFSGAEILYAVILRNFLLSILVLSLTSFADDFARNCCGAFNSGALAHVVSSRQRVFGSTRSSVPCMCDVPLFMCKSSRIRVDYSGNSHKIVLRISTWRVWRKQFHLTLI